MERQYFHTHAKVLLMAPDKVADIGAFFTEPSHLTTVNDVLGLCDKRNGPGSPTTILTFQGHPVSLATRITDLDVHCHRHVLLSAQVLPAQFRPSPAGLTGQGMSPMPLPMHPTAANAASASPTMPSNTPLAAATTVQGPNAQVRTPSRQPLRPTNAQLQSRPPHSSSATESSRLVDSSDENQRPADATPPKLKLRVVTKPQLDVPAMKSETEHDDDVRRAESPVYQPSTHKSPFADVAGADAEPIHRGAPLRELAQLVAPERLEAGVAAGIDVLAGLDKTLESMPSSADARAWLAQIEKARKEATKSRTVVGVVGNTGAGKSSVINAMLDEERLVPTNCMRACTAVVTEISYNDAKSERARYRAQIEFIKADEWRKELDVLFQEVFDENGHVVHEARNPDTEAGIALAKIRAVYHKHSNDSLACASVDSLMRDKSVAAILGTTRTITESSPQAFYRRLQHYVDSKEKGSEKVDKLGRKITQKKRPLEHWPLIRVVKIYTKAEALSTGAVIVDLPGVHDSNAARAAVAEGYMKQCTGLWIVAPINRAVDDKAAKTLLGDTFRRQLKYDGIYSAVTFICSKTDDISRTEATDSLRLGAEMGDIEDKLAVLARQRRDLQKQLKDARANNGDCDAAIDDIEEQLEAWENLQSKAEDGEEVFAPLPKGSKKRKRAQRSSPEGRRNSKRRSMDDSDDDFVDVDSDDGDDDADSLSGTAAAATSGLPLTLGLIEETLTELKDLKKSARKERSRLTDRMSDLRSQISDKEIAETQLDERQNELCIAGRNEYSRDAIRQDFAAGIRELDQENAIEECDANFNSDEDCRDYDEVARSLPVFCVSSRAYQKLCGRLSKDNDVAGFTTTQQTEIPALQAHCKKLTEHGRQASCRRFLNSLDQLLASLGFWSSDDGTGLKLTTKQKDAERLFLERQLKQLQRSLEDTIKELLVDASETLNEHIFDHFQPAIDAAKANAQPTSSKWARHRSEGGLHFMTYRATVRRDGVYSGASGPQDFNAQLSEPIYKQLASNWERVFQRRMLHILQSFTRAGADLLKAFHAAVEHRCRERGHGLARLGMLAQALPTYQQSLSEVAAAMVQMVNEEQREINRDFTPIITDAMGAGYELCANESGTGSWMRMKAHMANHVSQKQQDMFDIACREVKNSLEAMCDDVGETMLDRADGIFLNMQRDYMSIVGRVGPVVTMSREERSFRRQLDDAVTDADAEFRSVIEEDLDRLQAKYAWNDVGVDELPADEPMDEAHEGDDSATEAEEEARDGGNASSDTDVEADGGTRDQPKRMFAATVVSDEEEVDF